MVTEALARLGGVAEPVVDPGPGLPATGYRTTLRGVADARGPVRAAQAPQPRPGGRARLPRRPPPPGRGGGRGPLPARRHGHDPGRRPHGRPHGDRRRGGGAGGAGAPRGRADRRARRGAGRDRGRAGGPGAGPGCSRRWPGCGCGCRPGRSSRPGRRRPRRWSRRWPRPWGRGRGEPRRPVRRRRPVRGHRRRGVRPGHRGRVVALRLRRRPGEPGVAGGPGQPRRRAAVAPRRVDAVVADPPRAGLGRTGARVVAGTGARRLALVSCDAAALGRDAALLRAHGFDLEGRRWSTPSPTRRTWRSCPGSPGPRVVTNEHVSLLRLAGTPAW